MFDSNFQSQRYQKTAQLHNNTLYNQKTEQKLAPITSSSNATRVRLVKPIRNTEGTQITFNLPNSYKKMQIQSIKNRMQSNSQKNQQLSLKPKQIQDKNRQTYQQWLSRNSIKVGIKKNNAIQRQQKSVYVKNSQEEIQNNLQYQSLKNKVQSINKVIKTPLHIQNHRVNNIISKNHAYKSNNNITKVTYQNFKNRRNQFSPIQRQKHNDQKNQKLNSISENLDEVQNNFQNYLKKENLQQLKRLHRNIYINKSNIRQFNSYSAVEPISKTVVNQQPQDKQFKESFYPIILNKINNKNEPILYFAQSYKGRRPYNQDRYLCHTKNNQFLRQKITRFSGKIQNFTRHTQNVNGNCQEHEVKHKNNQKQGQSLFGVFDGHGGSKCAEFIKQNFYQILSSNKSIFLNPQQALKQTFLKVQQKFISISQKRGSLQTSGSCAVVAFLKNNKIYIGNVGDSRALLLSQKQIIQVTKDHKPDDKDEKLRIIRYGGKLYKDGSVMGIQGKQNIKIFNQTRIMPGSLNVSRTLGDIEVKLRKYGGLPGIVVPQPDIFVQNIDGRHQYLILASDGLFEGLQNQQIHQIYLKTLKNQYKQKFFHSDSFNKTLTNQLIRKAGQKSNDNITVICVKLSQNQSQQI